MPNTTNFNVLRKQLLARPGAAELLAEAREETLAEIDDYERRKRPRPPVRRPPPG